MTINRWVLSALLLGLTASLAWFAIGSKSPSASIAPQAAGDTGVSSPAPTWAAGAENADLARSSSPFQPESTPRMASPEKPELLSVWITVIEPDGHAVPAGTPVP